MSVAERSCVTARDIDWALAPAPNVATDDLLVDALVAAESFRRLAMAAVHHIHELHGDLVQLQRRCSSLVDENRALRVERSRR